MVTSRNPGVEYTAIKRTTQCWGWFSARVGVVSCLSQQKNHRSLKKLLAIVSIVDSNVDENLLLHPSWRSFSPFFPFATRDFVLHICSRRGYSESMAESRGECNWLPRPFVSSAQWIDFSLAVVLKWTRSTYWLGTRAHRHSRMPDGFRENKRVRVSDEWHTFR